MDPSAVDVICRDGGLLRLRTLGPDDAPAVIEFYRQLDERSRYRRFISHALPRDEVLLGPLNSDNPDDHTLGAELAGELVGVGIAIHDSKRDAIEVAFAVASDHQGRGIGTLLLEHLAATARDAGRKRFVANTLTSNLAMLDVFEQAGFRITEEVDQDDVSIVLILDDKADLAVAQRDNWSHAASIRRVLHPNSVAIIGASRTPGSVGHALLRNVLASSYCGTFYPVNLQARSVLGVAAYPSIADLPEVPDLAVIAVPAAAVRSVLIECGQAGVSSAVIVTAGFAEIDTDGASAEDELVELAHWYGMRIVGPNCIGIVNTAPTVSLNATFSPAAPIEGPIGFASQSGALGIAALDELHEVGLGISTFVSLGNKADVSGNDLLQYWENDPKTKVAALYLESFGNPRKFAQIARRFCRTKPIVAVKSGRTVSGRRAASSHTAALASSDLIADALFRDAGIIRVATLAELFDVCRVVATQPIPTGGRVAIVGNSGGPGILAADACEAAGLTVAPLSEATRSELRPLLLAGAGLSNPVDLIAAASSHQYEQALEVILADDDIDAVLVVYTDPMVSDAGDVAAAISRAAATSQKPIVANFLAADVGSTITDPNEAHPPIPVFDFPESAASALGHAAKLGAWRRQTFGITPRKTLGVDVDAARALVLGAAPDQLTRWMDPEQVASLLAEWGIDLMATVEVTSAAEAVSAAEEVGFPIALKVSSDTITHKTDVDGVQLDLDTADEVTEAFDDMKTRLRSKMSGAIVQPMAREGTELILGGLADPVFGPVVMFGAGGTTAEVWEDRAVALAPFNAVRAAELVREPKVFALLDGYRGAEPADIAAVEDTLVRLAALLDAHPEIVELDLNPVIASSDGLQIVDARCRIGPVQAKQGSPRRHLD